MSFWTASPRQRRSACWGICSTWNFAFFTSRCTDILPLRMGTDEPNAIFQWNPLAGSRFSYLRLCSCSGITIQPEREDTPEGVHRPVGCSACLKNKQKYCFGWVTVREKYYYSNWKTLFWLDLCEQCSHEWAGSISLASQPNRRLVPGAERVITDNRRIYWREHPKTNCYRRNTQTFLLVY